VHQYAFQRTSDTVEERTFQFIRHVIQRTSECPSHLATTGHQPIVGEKEADQRRYCDQHSVKICKKEESAGAKWKR